MDRQLQMLCARIAELLAQSGRRVVLAESCTAGLVSASLACVPGISDHLCGSAVVYREATKIRWLGVPDSLLAQHTATSEPATVAMAQGVLAGTPEASVSVAVTGHLGPGAPTELDGMIFVAGAIRCGDGRVEQAGVYRCRLQSEDRLARQREAAREALQYLQKTLEEAAED